MAKGDDIEERLINFAVAIIALCDRLPDTPGGRHVGGQLLRSGTSPASNYSEARSAESKRDFVHKLRIALKEMNESRVWLKVIIRSKMLPQTEVGPILRECEELCAILYSSIQTTQGRRPDAPPPINH
jgi:four helix bundle protein